MVVNSLKIDRLILSKIFFYGSVILFMIFPQEVMSSPNNPVSSIPAEGSINIGRESDLILNFGITACYFPMGQMFLKKTNDPGYSYELATGASNSSTITVPIPITLDSNTDYYIDIGAGKFSTCDFNFANRSDAFTVHFTTGNCISSTTCSCYNPPSCIGPCFGNTDIEHLSPPDNAHFVQSYEGLAIVFGTNVSLGLGNLYLREYDGDATVATIDVTSSAITGWGTHTLTIDIPDNVLAKNTHYYVNFDIEGWSLPADKDKWDFWTKSTPNTFSGSGL